MGRAGEDVGKGEGRMWEWGGEEEEWGSGGEAGE